MRVTHAMLNRQLMTGASRAYERMAGLDISRRITQPSDDPAGAQRMVQLRGLISQNEQYQSNSDTAYRWLLAADTSLSSLGENFRSVRELALTAADGSLEMELEGILESLNSAIDQILDLGNTRIGNSYLFGGSRTQATPFDMYEGGIGYRGDDQVLSTSISTGLSLDYNVSGETLFGGELPFLDGTEDWDAKLTWDTEIARLFDGKGAELGMIRITDGAGTSVSLDLSGLRSMGDLRDAIQSAFPGMTVEINEDRNLLIEGTGPITVEDLQGGLTAQALGIDGTHNSGHIISRDLDPALTEDTLLEDLMGMDITLGKIQVAVGYDALFDELDLSSAESVGDIINLIEGEFPDLRVEISPSGNRLAITSDSFTPFEIKGFEDDFTASLIGLEGKGVPMRPLEVLFELREAVESGDQQTVQSLLSEIEAVQKHITDVHGAVGSRLAMAEGAKTTLEMKNLHLTDTLSQLGDADLSETLMLYQNAEASYQASLMLASNIYQLTLANFL